MKQAKHNIVYKITNMVNGKIYFGAHQTDVLEDGYLGSGQLIKLAVKKYGRHNFQRTILFDFPTRDEMFAKEKEIVHQDFVKKQSNYNIRTGGSGFYFAHETFCPHAITPEYKMKVLLALLRVKEGRIPKEVAFFDSLMFQTFLSVLWNLRDDNNEFDFSCTTISREIGYDETRLRSALSWFCSYGICKKIENSEPKNKSPIYQWIGKDVPDYCVKTLCLLNNINDKNQKMTVEEIDKKRDESTIFVHIDPNDQTINTCYCCCLDEGSIACRRSSCFQHPERQHGYYKPTNTARIAQDASQAIHGRKDTVQPLPSEPDGLHARI